METKEFKIQVPEGYEIDKENSTFEKIVFKKVERELPKSWEDLKVVEGFYIDEDSGIYVCEDRYTDDENKNVFPTEEEAEACLALAQLCQLRDKYNDGWKPNWTTDDEEKYIISIHEGNPYTDCHYSIQRVLAFRTEELRNKFLENFKDLIEIAKPLL